MAQSILGRGSFWYYILMPGMFMGRVFTVGDGLFLGDGVMGCSWVWRVHGYGVFVGMACSWVWLVPG